MKRGETILKLVVEPSFTMEAKGTYRIVCTSKDEYFGQYIRKSALYEDPSKAIKIETPLSHDTVTALLDDMAQIVIPAFPQEDNHICDGTYYELSVGGFDRKSVFRWVSAVLPDSPWLPLEQLAQRIIDMIPSDPDKLIICPHCGSTDSIEILYGMPTLEAYEASKRGELIIGGCCMEIGAPDRKCKGCGRKWLHATDYLDQ